MDINKHVHASAALIVAAISVAFIASPAALAVKKVYEHFVLLDGYENTRLTLEIRLTDEYRDTMRTEIGSGIFADSLDHGVGEQSDRLGEKCQQLEKILTTSGATIDASCRITAVPINKEFVSVSAEISGITGAQTLMTALETVPMDQSSISRLHIENDFDQGQSQSIIRFSIRFAQPALTEQSAS